jgi:hypothetical protein
MDGKHLLSIKRAHVFRYSEYLTVLNQSVARPLKGGASTTVMADDFASVIYAIETDNQPRSGGIDADQIGISR